MNKPAKFSIIIPVKEINEYIEEAIPHILNQSYKNFEIIIFPDKKNKIVYDKRVKIIETGEIGPAEKRDLAIKYAKGNILCFLDDDAYPEKDWLESSLKNFEDEEIAAVGGPNLTPKNSNKFQRDSGFVLSTKIVSSSAAHRYKVSKRRSIDDFPSCNLFVRKDIFKKIKGFDCRYWPGEDTKLCLEIIKLGKKIVYDPKVIVYHHRRKNLNAYFKQISSYAKHRGNFARKRDKNSFKLSYFVPTFFVVGIVVGSIVSLLNMYLLMTYLFLGGIYICWMGITSLSGMLKGHNLFRVGFLIFITHLVYGIGFIMGLLKKDLKR